LFEGIALSEKTCVCEWDRTEEIERKRVRTIIGVKQTLQKEEANSSHQQVNTKNTKEEANTTDVKMRPCGEKGARGQQSKAKNGEPEDPTPHGDSLKGRLPSIVRLLCEIQQLCSLLQKVANISRGHSPRCK
jgi:hypothetical protein